jgi:hypothetical protein
MQISTDPLFSKHMVMTDKIEKEKIKRLLLVSKRKKKIFVDQKHNRNDATKRAGLQLQPVGVWVLKWLVTSAILALVE